MSVDQNVCLTLIAIGIIVLVALHFSKDPPNGDDE